MANGNGNGNGDGRVLRPKVRIQTFFIYPVPEVFIGPASEASATVRIDSATDFLWFKTAFFARDDAGGAQTDATRIIPEVLCQIQVSGADRNLFQAPVPIASFAGDGRIPFILPAPMVLLANSEVRFDFTNNGDTRDLDIALALIGLKDFGELEAAGAQ
jgi:hypothetical protein